MQAKLTLRLDKELIEQAKAFSGKSEKSLSKLVANYFKILIKDSTVKALPEKTASLRGILKDKSCDKKDYNNYLEKKYL